MLIRCRSFTRYPKMVTYLTIPTWIVRFGLCIWLVTTITGEDNEAGYVCNTSMDYNLSAIMQYIKIATEVIILVFFLERVIALHRTARNTAVDNHWRRLALINAGITFLVILFEVLVGQVTVYLTGYCKDSMFALFCPFSNVQSEKKKKKNFVTHLHLHILLLHLSVLDIQLGQLYSGYLGRLHCRGYQERVQEACRR